MEESPAEQKTSAVTTPRSDAGSGGYVAPTMGCVGVVAAALLGAIGVVTAAFLQSKGSTPTPPPTVTSAPVMAKLGSIRHGHVHGTLMQQYGVIPHKNAQIRLTCGEEVYNDETDESGAFDFFEIEAPLGPDGAAHCELSALEYVGGTTPGAPVALAHAVVRPGQDTNVDVKVFGLFWGEVDPAHPFGGMSDRCETPSTNCLVYKWLPDGSACSCGNVAGRIKSLG